MRWHRGLTVEKWRDLPVETRIAHVQSEIVRARDSQASGYYHSTELALERALELLDLTVATCIGNSPLRDLLRWRERIARFYVFPDDPIPEDLVVPRWDNPRGDRPRRDGASGAPS